MYTDKDTEMVTKAIDDYLADNWEFFGSYEKWHAKAIEYVAEFWSLEDSEVEHFRPLIVEIATKYNDERYHEGREYNLAATREEVFDRVKELAMESDETYFPSFLTDARYACGDLIIRDADRHWIEEAANEYKFLLDIE